MTLRRSLPPEVTITLAFLGFTLLLSLVIDMPFSLPTTQSAAFVGIHYLYPLIAIGLWAVYVVHQRKQSVGTVFLVALPCYAIVLLCHFNLKLWIYHVNPASWDAYYWWTDQQLRPLVDGAMALRLLLADLVPLDSNFYMLGFIALFYLSFGYHAAKTPEAFHELVLAALLLQIFGSIAYFVAPAIGPFLYEAGVEPPATGSQQYMLAVLEANKAGGAEWLQQHGGAQLTAGLAAMPSLHAGGSLLFLIYAWRTARGLLWIMVPLFAFISFDAIANRWHYVIDLPVGWAVAAAAVAAAGWIMRSPGAHQVTPVSPREDCEPQPVASFRE